MLFRAYLTLLLPFGSSGSLLIPSAVPALHRRALLRCSRHSSLLAVRIGCYHSLAFLVLLPRNTKHYMPFLFCPCLALLCKNLLISQYAHLMLMAALLVSPDGHRPDVFLHVLSGLTVAVIVVLCFLIRFSFVIH